MILSPLLRMQLHPKLCCWIKQSRNIRPNIQVGKDKFRLQIDVRNYDKDDIRVKARPDYVVIEGKQQKRTKRGMVMRHFIRKFRLPTGCVMESMESKLSPDGMLTITAPRKSCEPSSTCETLIPIKPGFDQKDLDASFVPVQDHDPKPGEASQDPCAPSKQDQTTPPSSPSNKQK